MKRNVDLTLDRDFQPRFSLSEITKILSHSFLRHPWNMDGILNSLDSEDILIFTGNKNDRSGRKKWFSGLCCERCGRDFSKLPWRFESGLCRSCDEEFKKEFEDEDNFVLTSLRKTLVRQRQN